MYKPTIVYLCSKMQRRDVGHAAVFQIIDFRLFFFPSRRPSKDKRIFQFSDFIFL